MSWLDRKRRLLRFGSEARGRPRWTQNGASDAPYE
jgi:hypothetical protein